jgi:DNA-binding Lrp family transcriptional regulator
METLDELDYKLLDLLQKNAKAPTKYLAAEIGLSVTPTFERIKRMERLGIIKGYTISLDKTKIGKGLRVLCQVSLTEHKEELITLFEKEIKLLYHLRIGNYKSVKVLFKDGKIERLEGEIIKVEKKIHEIMLENAYDEITITRENGEVVNTKRKIKIKILSIQLLFMF